MEPQSNSFVGIEIEKNGTDNSFYPGRKNKIVEDIDSFPLEKQKTLRYTQDTKYRKILAHWVMYIVSIWLGLVLFVISFNEIFHFNIDKTVCIVLLGTTTINILGLAYIVLKGIFPNKAKE